MKMRMILSLLLAVLLAAPVASFADPWCVDCESICSLGNFFCVKFCGVSTSDGDRGAKWCIVQRDAEGDDVCYRGGSCTVGGL